MSSKKTPFPPPLSQISCFLSLFVFHSFVFFSTFSHENTWEKIRGETELGGEREGAIEFHREVSLQANKKAAEILLLIVKPAYHLTVLR